MNALEIGGLAFIAIMVPAAIWMHVLIWRQRRAWVDAIKSRGHWRVTIGAGRCHQEWIGPEDEE